MGRIKSVIKYRKNRVRVSELEVLNSKFVEFSNPTHKEYLVASNIDERLTIEALIDELKKYLRCVFEVNNLNQEGHLKVLNKYFNSLETFRECIFNCKDNGSTVPRYVCGNVCSNYQNILNYIDQIKNEESCSDKYSTLGLLVIRLWSLN